tara:strand:- start:828 stop:1268 length:441 start_codon:yes stop_codon:yes gene_type:complete
MILEEIKLQLKQAMKKGDKEIVLAIRNILEKIKKEEVDLKKKLNENSIIKIIAKHTKQLRESIVQFKKGNRMDLAEKEQKELLIAEKFLPEKLEEDEVKKIVLIAIQELNATTMSDMSKVMKVVIEKTKGMVDGKLISNLVRGHLT